DLKKSVGLKSPLIAALRDLQIQLEPRVSRSEARSCKAPRDECFLVPRGTGLQLTIQCQQKRKIKNMTTLHSRKSIDRSPLRRAFRFGALALVLACCALAPASRALLPPPAPDGGYPGANTAEGDNSLFSLTTGDQNTANGANALFSLTTGSFNTAAGAGALFSDTAGGRNTANGVDALRSNTTGIGHTAIGFRTLYNYAGANPGCCGNTAIGDTALFSDTTGIANTATGFTAMFNNTTGFNNTANGVAAMYHNTTADRNTGIGTN